MDDKISKEDFLAVNVMGWKYELSKITNKPCKTGIYIDGEDLDSCDSWMESCHWRPSTNIEQAHMLLDQFGRWDITTLGVLKTVSILQIESFGGLKIIGTDNMSSDKCTATAITESVLKASGYYG